MRRRLRSAPSSLCSPFTPFPLAWGNEPGVWGAGVDSCMGSAFSSLGLAMLLAEEDFNALSRLSSSGGRLSGCESEDFLREAKVLLLRGLLGFLSLSVCSLTKELRLFFSGDDCADRDWEWDLCASEGSTAWRAGRWA